MNDDNVNIGNNDRQQAKNVAEWKAWIEWKEKCNVFLCSVENAKILSDVIFEAFKRKLESVSRVIYEDWKGTGAFLPNDGQSMQMEFVSEFNFGIETKKNEGIKAAARLARGEEPRREETLTTASPRSRKRIRVSPKDYKALAFNLALAQPDDPLRAIRGQLVGRLGIINAIVEHYLLYSCGLSLDWVADPETGKRSIGFLAKSLDVMMENRQEKEVQQEKDMQNDEKASTGKAESDPLDAFVTPSSAKVDGKALREFKNDLQKTYSPKQMAILLAYLNAMPISAKALQDFYGAKHAAVDKAFHALVIVARDPTTGKKIPVDIPGIASLRDKFLGRLNFRERDVYLSIPAVFRETIGKEPGGRAFLSALSTWANRRKSVAPNLRPAEPAL